jgi:hypothetical protein
LPSFTDVRPADTSSVGGTSIGGWTASTGTLSTSLGTLIGDNPAIGSPDSDYIENTASGTFARNQIDDLWSGWPSDLGEVDTIECSIYYAVNSTDDTFAIEVQLYDSTGTTSYTNSTVILAATANVPGGSFVPPVSMTLTSAGLAASLTDWKNAGIWITTTLSQVMGGDAGRNVRIHALELSGTYTASGATGTIASTLESATSTASGIFTDPPVTGTVAQTLSPATSTASGTFTPPGATGTIASTLESATSTASGTFTAPGATGTVASTLAAATSTATGLFVVSGRKTITFVDSATSGSASSPLTATLPTGYTTDDLFIAQITTREDDPTPSHGITTSSVSWTQIGTTQFLDLGTTGIAQSLWYRWAASASETAPVATCTSPLKLAVTISAFRNVDLTTPFYGASIQEGTNAASSTFHPQSAALVPGATTTMAVSFVSSADANSLSLSDAQGFTLQYSEETV